MAGNGLSWVECNACPNKTGLSLTECGHLYCQNCVAKLKSNNNKCLICKRPTSHQTLDELSDDTKEFFKPMNILGALSNLTSTFQTIDKFHNMQSEVCLRNKYKKELFFKNQLQNAHSKIQSLMKALAIKDTCLKEREVEINNLKVNLKEQQRSTEKNMGNAASQTSRMSTPNSTAFMKGILRNSRSMNQIVTSTPIDNRYNATPQYPPRPSSIPLGTPTPFITPQSTYGSAEHRQQKLIDLNQKRHQKTQSSILRDRSFVSGQNEKVNNIRMLTPSNDERREQLKLDRSGSASGIPIRQSQGKLEGVGLVGRGLNSTNPPREMGRDGNGHNPSPSLISYRNLVQGNTGTRLNHIMKDGLNSGLSSGSQSTSSLRMKTSTKTNLNINMISYLKRKRN